MEDIDATELVTGDVTDVTAGEIVPADLLLIGGSYLSIDQAALTGELLPVDKAVGDGAYSGSIAKQGDMQGVVTAIGNNTFFGRTAKLVASAGAKSHSQKAVVEIGDFLILLAAALAVVLVGVQVYRQMVVPGHWSWDVAGQITQFILVLLVASVPVALPAVMSVTLALGALALSKQKAIVSRLSAIDELAGVDILCSDKTGTLTQNKLTLTTPIPFGNTKPDDIVFGAALATKANSEDAIDSAVLKAVADPEGARSVQADESRAVRPGEQADDDHRRRRQWPGLAIRQGRAASDLGAVQARSDHRSVVFGQGRRSGEARLPGARSRELGRRRKDMDVAGAPAAVRPAAARRQVDDRPDQDAGAFGEDGHRRRCRHRKRNLGAARPRDAPVGGQRRLRQEHRPGSHPARRGARGRARRRLRARLPTSTNTRS